MREILFRGKRKDNGELVEGHLIQSPCMGVLRSWISTPEDKTRLRTIATYYGDWRAVEVGTDTICQYTGLTDKNGNKIWENDILRYSYDYENSPWLEAKGLTNKDIKYYIGAVFWQEWRGVWAVCGKGTSRGCNQDVYVYSRNPNRVEVIGNIFDNADLLKGE